MEDLGTFDVAVIGGGLVGTATALGMADLGASVAILDAGDINFRASRGNFGLVWAQSKGANSRDYATWTRSAVTAWPWLQDELRALTGVETDLQSGMGLHLCLSEEEYHARAKIIEGVAGHNIAGDDTRMIDRQQVAEIMPQIGPKVYGASISSLDGACQSLSLYRGLSEGAQAKGAKLFPNTPVTAIHPLDDGYEVIAGVRRLRATKILLATGVANNELAAPFGFPPMVRPQRGQILVTERAKPMLPCVTSWLRQTSEGTILIGDTKEEVGLDDRSTAPSMMQLARRATDALPEIGKLRIVRSWGALRVLSFDGLPVYDESPTHSGVFVATTHSAVTLAPAHRGPLAQWILNGQKPPEFASFGAQRFNK
ncbi:FAD-dependent oxidoreductase [Thioclava sp. GXIMD2076]|uniref:NAD(P)/FAD-dependent oxidoreductase n=1 Tax=unclassified Thioclava TaxID=2621713 RepID=UPI0030CACE6F